MAPHLPPRQRSLIVNGRPLPMTKPDEPLLSLLHRLSLDPRYLVVELNGEPLARSDFETRRLAPGDVLELVRPVAGG